MLSRLSAVIITLFAAFFFADTSFAACLPVNTGVQCTAPNSVSCSFSTTQAPSITLRFCCGTNPGECSTKQAEVQATADKQSQNNADTCKPAVNGGCTGTNVLCTKLSDPISKAQCCSSASACTKYKNGTLNTKSVYKPVDICDYAGDKKTECDACKATGVWTALGCISFTQDEFVVNLIQIIMGLAGFISLALMLTGVIIMMTGGANPEQMKKGKEIFTGAVVGLLFLIFSVIVLQIITRDFVKIDITGPQMGPPAP